MHLHICSFGEQGKWGKGKNIFDVEIPFCFSFFDWKRMFNSGQKMYTYYFEKMRVWQNARELLTKTYLITDSFPPSEDYHLKSQMRRSASSVKTNIAEGQGRKTKKDQAHFTSLAYSSLIEFLNHVLTARDLNMISEIKYEEIRKDIDQIAKELNALKRVQLSKA